MVHITSGFIAIGLVLLTAGQAALAFSEDQQSVDLLERDTPGQYVYYKDQRSGRNRVTGLLKADANRLLVRTIDLKSGHSTSVAVQLENKSGEIQLSILEVFNGDVEKDRAYVESELADLFNARASWLKQGKLNQPIRTKAMTVTFSRWVPILGINHVQTKKGELRIALVGRDEPPVLTFVDMTDLPLVKKANVKLLDVNKSKRPVTVFGKRFIFDKNWKHEKAGQAGAKVSAFLLQVSGDRDAMLAFEEYPMPNEGAGADLFEQALNAVLSVPVSWIIPETFKWTANPDGSFEFRFSSLHMVSLRKTGHRLLFRLDSGRQKLRIINFSGFDEYLQSNPAYFERLLSPIGFRL